MITKLSSSCQCHRSVKKSLNENQIAAFVRNDSLSADIQILYVQYCRMTSLKALYDFCGFKFKWECFFINSTKDLMFLMLLKLGLRACVQTFLQG